MTSMLRKTAISVTVAALAVALSAGVPWVDNNQKPKMRDHEPLSHAQRADEAYERGRHLFHQALEFEDKALAATSDGKRRRYRDKAVKRYRASVDAFELCLERALEAGETPEYLPNLYQELADSLFKTGEYARAIETYDKTLAIAPAYTRATYGRAEAQLALDNIAEVKQAFAALLTETETSAEAWGYVDALLVSGEHWLAAQASDQATVDAQTAADFRGWHEAQVAELEDTVRWTLLDAQ